MKKPYKAHFCWIREYLFWFYGPGETDAIYIYGTRGETTFIY